MALPDVGTLDDTITDNRQRLQKSLRAGQLNIVKSIQNLRDPLNNMILSLIDIFDLQKRQAEEEKIRSGFLLEQMRESGRKEKGDDKQTPEKLPPMANFLKSFQKFGIGKFLIILAGAFLLYANGLADYVRTVLIGTTLRQFKTIGTTITKAFSVFKDGKLYAGIVKVLQAPLTFFRFMGDALKPFAQQTMSLNWVQQVIKFLQLPLTFFRFIGDALKPFAQQTQIFSKIGSIAAGLGSILKTVGTTIQTGFSFIGSLFSRISTFLSPILSLIPGLKAIPVIGQIIAAIFAVFDFVKGFFSGLGEETGLTSFEQVLFAVWSGVKEVIKGFLLKPLDLIKDGISWVLEKMGFESFSETLDSFSFVDTFDKITGFIEKVIRAVRDFFADQIKKVTSVLKKIPLIGGLFGGSDEEESEFSKREKEIKDLEKDVKTDSWYESKANRRKDKQDLVKLYDKQSMELSNQETEMQKALKMPGVNTEELQKRIEANQQRQLEIQGRRDKLNADLDQQRTRRPDGRLRTLPPELPGDRRRGDQINVDSSSKRGGDTNISNKGGDTFSQQSARPPNALSASDWV